MKFWCLKWKSEEGRRKVEKSMNVVDNFDLDSENLKRYARGKWIWKKLRNFDFWFEETRSNYLINNQIEIDSCTIEIIVSLSNSLSSFFRNAFKTIVNDVRNKVKNSRNGITLCNLTFNQRYNRGVVTSSLDYKVTW